MSVSTPGPWRRHRLDGNQLILAVNGKEIAVVYGNDGTSAANANLISAAPSMLESLERTMHLLGWDDQTVDQKGAKGARAAVAQARKRSNQNVRGDDR